MNKNITVPNPVLDNREIDKIDLLTKDYEKYRKPGMINKSLNKVGDSISQVIPEKIKCGVSTMKQGISESDLMKQALGVVAKGFTELESRAAQLTVSKQTVVKRIGKVDAGITCYEDICLARGYDIETALNLKDMEDILYTAVQGGVTGFFGFPAIPVNIALSTFLYFRAVQNIALHYGYDVKNDIGELEIASVVTMQALNPNMESGAKTLSSMIGKMMIMTKTTALQQGLNKTYGEMINKGGIQLLFVQIRALANNAAMKALDKAGKKGLEKTVYSEMLEQLGKQLSKSAGKKLVPVIGGFIGALFDTAYMARVLKYAKIVYHKRYLLEKEQRIMYLVDESSKPREQ
ncbi:EcsC family protein [Anaerosolibacter sp.]|uniref:EcsC family protein n=1 Tax=Anaerosolibacter sp. TaxID=1872527 RepID=UPI0039EF4261